MMARKFLVLLLILIIAVTVLLIKVLFTKDAWDLTVCSSLMADGVQCQENSYVLKGYKTQAECMEKGIELAKNEGFECGKNCRQGDGWSGITCEVICNKEGCN
ncbi:hypothetical protein A3A66_01815 [Microgenomates group bacterium RIFCSPLOWO2_01_FULL_46_13]|nr:MAG: hypothetical protein A3A66_01815 [Microgenomates group bacterium RIFCSPLOWO2_01_FULL_46_13]